MKRWLTCILMCFFLGMVTTVGVAWGLSLFVRFDGATRQTSSTTIDGGDWRFEIISQPGALRMTSESPEDHKNHRGEHGEVFCHFDFPVRDENVVLPHWSAVRRQSWRTGITTPVEEARGWPLLALRYEYSFAARLLSGWIALPPSQTSPETRMRSREILRSKVGGGIIVDESPLTIVPTTPIWRGLLIDTLFYAVIWFGLFFGFSAARRGLRKRRGLCPMCAYDLRGDLDNGCPECGWGRKSDAPE